MRIVHVVTRSHRRGAEVVAIELADELDALGHDNQLVALALAFDGGAEARLSPLVDTTSVGPATMIRSSWRLRRLLSASPADVVIAHGGWGAQVAALGFWPRRDPLRLGRVLWGPPHAGPRRSRLWACGRGATGSFGSGSWGSPSARGTAHDVRTGASSLGASTRRS